MQSGPRVVAHRAALRRCGDVSETPCVHHATMPRKTDQPQRRPLRSFILRVVEQRVMSVSVVYELHDIATGARRSFETLESLQRFLARQPRRAA